MKTTIILTAALTVFMLTGAHGYSNVMGSNNPVNNNNSVSEIKAIGAKTITPVEVKNIWHNAPSFDKYGNEITARARLNMEINSKIEKMNKKAADLTLKGAAK